MKIHHLLNEENAQTVLMKMATTIDPSTGGENGYTNRSCFGRVAHYLKNHRNPNWYIMLFGFVNNGEVTHCCLYDNNGTRVVDTFDGAPKHINGNIVYVDKFDNHHELLASMTVS